MVQAVLPSMYDDDDFDDYDHDDMSTHVHHLINDINDSRYERLLPLFNRTIIPSPHPDAPYTDPRSDNSDEDHLINDQ